ncbi:FtsX-like permease family protein [Clostridium sp. DSM 100503]|uniref:ABC transporter permease n=1 Tax=Clostridium sp. DSM 100503 TaxID=2963282 RepID=UPI002149DCAE|nr:FtsX-like permease family protein [Clostridium sp. DSM 100503]MCR1952595.1 FtsX-like permease family protein [Clostridium sp. DSM 100503]
MYSKIAFNNVKKSIKDYAIYFLTLTFAVCIFYSFNSIESQKAIFEMNSSQSNTISGLSKIIGMVSIFVSVILGSLIIYANNFLIKKRKKELGIYMTLGMGKSKISKILLCETLIIGIMSLLAGLVLGMIFSQGLSVFTAKLFDVWMREYKFIISFEAMIKSTIYFGIMFLLVMIFNTVVVSKYKLIDMLTASRKSENVKFKNPIVNIIIFILSIIILFAAYYLVIKAGLNPEDSRFVMSLVLGIVGTLLFFISLGRFSIYLIQNNKKAYFKELNIFVLRQISSKVNTNFVSMTIISLMLFLTITTLSTGLSFKNALESSLKDTTPFSASALMFLDERSNSKDIKENLDKLNFKFNDDEKYIIYTEYISNEKLKDILKDYIKSPEDIKGFGDNQIEFIKISDYNKIKSLKGEKDLYLNQDEVLIASSFGNKIKEISKFAKNEETIILSGEEYKIANSDLITESFYTDSISENVFTIIVPDNFKGELIPSRSILNVNYSEGKYEEKYEDLFTDFRSGSYTRNDYTDFVLGYTRNQIYTENKSMTTVILFIAIYLGIVFLISSAAILSLQQLSEAVDSKERYSSLKRIGASKRMINKTIFKQTIIYFMIPLILAIVHSIVGISVINDFIVLFNKPSIGLSSFVTLFTLVAIYAGYFYATYTGYKNVVK